MIRIKVESNGGTIRRVRVDGHGGGKKGNDIACAAVSAVTQTALQGLLDYAPGFIRWTMESGRLDISVIESDAIEVNTAVHIILTTMNRGLKRIADEYPDRISYLSVDDTGITDEA